ncbi:MAG: cysteine--tRNA ligase [Deltaproteobacteria bacterium]|nr:cysteine--tRNA ligase [Deltaproteobacteria bacterium]
MPEPFRLYNTLSRKVEDFQPLEPGKIGIYVCGMTVYDHIHVGHARAMVVFDAFVRYARYRGWDVHFVRNFTDVDDKIISRALDKGEDPAQLAQRYIDAFHEDVAALGLIQPDDEPRVTTSMGAIKDLIQSLIDNGHAYQNEGSVWFSVKTFSEYGKLSNQKVDELRNPDDWAGKKDAADFALWKASKEGEPSWDSPWGPGRPGWHIECSAMARSCIGDRVDIHGGGLDLVFPHHENEIAQSECGNGSQYVNYWMHNGLLTMSSGQKMGKSLGNVINVRLALEEFPAESLRLYYLQNQYRSPLPWGEQVLPDALAMLQRLYEAKENAESMGGQGDGAQIAKELGADATAVYELGLGFPDKFHHAMDSDFNTAGAMGHLFELARAVNRFGNHKKAKKRGGPVVAPALAAFELVRDSIGLFAMTAHDFHEEVKIKRLGAMGVSREQVDALIAERSQARADKNWQRADEIRDELISKSIEVMDTPEGVQWRVKLTVSDDS